MIQHYDWSNKTILVVEDEEVNYLFLEEVLRRTGAKIFWAKDGKQAIDTYHTCKADIILMDLKMPGMNGYEALDKIKESKGKTKVIAQTAFAMAGEKEEILEAGFDGYISKPIRIQELLKILETSFTENY